MDLGDLANCIIRGMPIKETAECLCRDVDEVLSKIAELKRRLAKSGSGYTSLSGRRASADRAGKSPIPARRAWIAPPHRLGRLGLRERCFDVFEGELELVGRKPFEPFVPRAKAVIVRLAKKVMHMLVEALQLVAGPSKHLQPARRLRLRLVQKFSV